MSINDDIWESIRIPMVKWVCMDLDNYSPAHVEPIAEIDPDLIYYKNKVWKFGDYGTHYIYGWYVVNERAELVFAGVDQKEFERIRKIIKKH